MKLIALGHKARCGKDTIADYLVAHHKFVKIALSAEIYKVTDYIQREVIGVEPYKNRKLLIGIGKLLREDDEDVWVNAALNKIANMDKTNINGIIITDIRLPNDYRAFKNAGYTMVKVTRPGAELLVEEFARTDISETALNDHEWDVVINNDGTINELYKKTSELVGYDTHY